MEFKRHNLVEITRQGREWALEHISLSGNLTGNYDLINQLIIEGINSIQIPGIIRREDNEIIAGAIPVGFASPYLLEGSRCRIPAFVPLTEIKSMLTPYEVIKYRFICRTLCLQVLEVCIKEFERIDAKLGVWGSAGLEVSTGLPYTHNLSDLDLIITMGEQSSIQEINDRLDLIEKTYGCRIDAEIDLPLKYGVKLKEMFLGTAEVLGKGLTDIKMFSRESIIKLLGGNK